MEKQQLNTTTIYILAIVGLLCCCFGGLGFIPSGIAYIMANNKLKEVQANPENYDNISAMQTAKTVALIITIINAAIFIFNIYDLSTGGYEARQEQFRQIMEQYGKEVPATE